MVNLELPPPHLASVAITEDGLVVTLTRIGAILLGHEIDPDPRKFQPIVLRGMQARVAALVIAHWQIDYGRVPASPVDGLARRPGDQVPSDPPSLSRRSLGEVGTSEKYSEPPRQ